MDLSERIGKNIRDLRMAKKLSQEDLAFKTGMHQSQIYRFEKGKQLINIKHLEKISNVFGVPVVEFFKTDIKLHNGIDDQQLLELFYQMPKSKKSELVELLNQIKDYDFKVLRKAIDIIEDIKEK